MIFSTKDGMTFVLLARARARGSVLCFEKYSINNDLHIQWCLWRTMSALFNQRLLYLTSQFTLFFQEKKSGYMREKVWMLRKTGGDKKEKERNLIFLQVFRKSVSMVGKNIQQ